MSASIYTFGAELNSVFMRFVYTFPMINRMFNQSKLSTYLNFSRELIRDLF